MSRSQHGPDLPAGARVGRFEILGLLGRGGSGRVYRARDPQLGREVALKVLAESLPADAQGRARLEREARVLASLNHPHIAAIHGFEFVDEVPCLVLELVEGRTLAEELREGALPVRRAIRLALQVAEALEEAHRRGVVHRDLKPANVVAGSDGRVKVLDFGLATARTDGGRQGGARPATSGHGTAPYMSPEQARGETVGAASDNWSFGVLLFEMLAGRNPFQSPSTPELLASILRDEPDWRALPAATPPALRRLLRRCLRKEPPARLQHIGDARLELLDLLEAPPRWRVRLRRGAILAAVFAAGSLVSWWRTPGSRPGATVRLSLELPEGLTLARDYAAPFALAPDGSRAVVLAGREDATRLYQRPLDRAEATPLAGTEGAWQPFFSPDGQWIAYFADRKLRKVALAGGQPLDLAELGSNPRGGSWAEDGTIVLAPSQTSGLVTVGADGGPLRPLTELDFAAGERSHRWPQVMPGGRFVLFTVHREGTDFDDGSLEAVPLAGGARRRLLSGAGFGRMLPSGHLLFARAGRLFAVPFDPGELRPRGEPRAVLEGVAYDSRNGGTQVAFANDGTLLFVPGLPGVLERRLVAVERTGRRQRLSGPDRRFRDLRLGPPGQLAVRVGPPDDAEVWIQELASGRLSPLTHGLRPHRPVYSRDGTRLAVSVERNGRWQLLSLPSGGGAPLALLEDADRMYPGDWLPGDRGLVFQVLRAATGWDVALLPLDASGRAAGAPRALATSRASEENPRVSPDGRWLAYESDEVDALVDVYVRALPEAGAAAKDEGGVKASRDGGRWPVWGRGGELLYWASPERGVRRVSWRVAAQRFDVLAEAELWPEGSAQGLYVSLDSGFDLTADGERVIVLETDSPGPAPTPRIAVLLRWFDELRRQRW